MNRTLKLSAIVAKDGTLAMYRGELDAYLKENIGNRLIISIQAEPRGTTAAMRGYYFGYIVPRVQLALYDLGERMTKAETDEWIRSQCPACQQEDGLLSVSDMGKCEMSELIDFTKQFAAENLYLVLEDADAV